MTRIGLRRWRIRPRLVSAVCLQVIVAALAIIGFSIWPLLVLAAAPWLVIFAHRFGSRSAIAVVTLGSAWLLLAVLMALAVVQLPMLGTVITIWLVIGLTGSVVLGDERFVVRMSRNSAMLWLPAMLGPLIWSATVVASFFIRGTDHYAWILGGDSANNVLFAREVLRSGGVAIGASENPVPLPAALIALSASDGRSGVPPAGLLQHDLTAFVFVWVILIAATCYFAGIAAAAVVRGSRPWIVALTGAGVSLFPLSWLVTGYPMEFGFFNVHVMLPIVFACWIATLSMRRAPTLVLICLLMAGTLLLAVWSPLVLIPMALGLYLVVSQWGALLRARGLRLILLAFSFVQFIGYAVVVILPGFVAQGKALSGAGAVYPFSKFLVAGVFFIGGLTFIAAIVRKSRAAAWLLFSVFAGTGVGLAALLFVSRNAPSPWTYYPVKLAWIASIIGVIVVVGVLASLISQGIRNQTLTILSLGVIALAVVMMANWAPTKVPGYPWMNPLDRILSVTAPSGGDRIANRIFELSDPAHPHVLWHSGDAAEGTINFWLLQMRANSTTKNTALRVFAYGYDKDNIKDLCSIIQLMGGRVTVITAELGLQSQLDQSCPVISSKTKTKTKIQITS